MHKMLQNEPFPRTNIKKVMGRGRFADSTHSQPSTTRPAPSPTLQNVGTPMVDSLYSVQLYCIRYCAGVIVVSSEHIWCPNVSYRYCIVQTTLLLYIFCDVIEVPPAELYRILHCILSVRPSVCLFKIDRWSKVRPPTKQCHFTGHMTQPTVPKALKEEF